MGRPPRAAFAGATYHLTAHGNNGANLFTDDYDRYAYLALLARNLRIMTARLFAYALMTTHLHLVLQTAAANISATVHRLHGPYAHAFNRRHGRRGHLFERRFGSELIEDNIYLLEATRYTHLNPVRAGIVQRPEDYPWSSYRYYTASNGEAGSTLVDPAPVLQLFSADATVSRRGYERFIRDGMAKS
jgi:putative transposase